MSDTDALARRATIPQRLDRLPLTWTLWRLALVTQAGWALVVATDAIAARIYPFVWGPRRAFDTAAFSILLLVSTGAGIVAGEYLFALLSDRFGRRRTLLAAAATCGLGTLPAGFVDDFWLLTLSLGIGAMGIGGVLATCTVYMAEVAPSQVRGRMTQTSQALAVFLLVVLTSLPGILLMPEHYQAYVVVMAAGPLLLVLLVAFVLPESPRWLDAHGRHEQAEAVVSTLERDCETRAGPLPAPIAGDVVPQSQATVRDLFGPEYGRRTVLLLACWLLGYSGLVYGVIGFLNLYLARVGFSAQAVFISGLISGVVGGAAGLLAAARLNERFERRAVILAGALIACLGLALVFLAGEVWHSLPALSIAAVVLNAGANLWLFNMYTYTALAYPTRIRSVGTGWTDGFGHLGSMVSPLIVGALFTATADLGYIGFFGYVIIPGALLPALLVARFGMEQKGAPLETVADA
jgi:putative MFS transporter